MTIPWSRSFRAFFTETLLGKPIGFPLPGCGNRPDHRRNWKCVYKFTRCAASVQSLREARLERWPAAVRTRQGGRGGRFLWALSECQDRPAEGTFRCRIAHRETSMPSPCSTASWRRDCIVAPADSRRRGHRLSMVPAAMSAESGRVALLPATSGAGRPIWLSAGHDQLGRQANRQMEKRPAEGQLSATVFPGGLCRLLKE